MTAPWAVAGTIAIAATTSAAIHVLRIGETPVAGAVVQRGGTHLLRTGEASVAGAGVRRAQSVGHRVAGEAGRCRRRIRQGRRGRRATAGSVALHGRARRRAGVAAPG